MDLASASETAPAPSRAAQYVRMSTEHQQYSPENQLEVIRQYAAARKMEIVQDYSDHGEWRRFLWPFAQLWSRSFSP